MFFLQAAGAVKKLVSTVIASDEKGFLDHSLDRSKYRASEMPQAFQRQVIENAYDKVRSGLKLKLADIIRFRAPFQKESYDKSKTWLYVK